MSYGFYSINDLDLFQISEDLTNYALVVEGSFTISSNNDFNNTPPERQDVTVPGFSFLDGDLVAIKSNLSGGLYTDFSALSSTLKVTHWMPLNAVVNYRVYRKTDTLTPATSGYGLEVYDISGTNLKFSTSKTNMIVQGLKENTNSGSVSIGDVSTTWSGVQPYIVSNVGMGYIARRNEEDPIPSEIEYVAVSSSSSNNYVGITFHEFLGGGFPEGLAPPDFQRHAPPTIILKGLQ